MPWLGIEPAPNRLPVRRSTTRATKATFVLVLFYNFQVFFHCNLFLFNSSILFKDLSDSTCRKKGGVVASVNNLP